MNVRGIDIPPELWAKIHDESWAPHPRSRRKLMWTYFSFAIIPITGMLMHAMHLSKGIMWPALVAMAVVWVVVYERLRHRFYQREIIGFLHEHGYCRCGYRGMTRPASDGGPEYFCSECGATWKVSPSTSNAPPNH